MGNLSRNIYEHLKTKKKYNNLQISYDMLQEQYNNKVIELDQEKKTKKILEDNFNQELDKLLDEKIKLKEEIKELKKKIRNKMEE